jgi:hypothetical protein
LRALSRSGWFIVAVSEAALQSAWVKFEVRWALKYRTIDQIRVLLLENVQSPRLDARLSRIRTIDFRTSTDEGRKQLQLEIPYPDDSASPPTTIETPRRS